VKRTDENPNAPLTDRTGLNDDQKGPWQIRLESLVDSAIDLLGLTNEKVNDTNEEENKKREEQKKKNSFLRRTKFSK